MLTCLNMLPAELLQPIKFHLRRHDALLGFSGWMRLGEGRVIKPPSSHTLQLPESNYSETVETTDAPEFIDDEAFIMLLKKWKVKSCIAQATHLRLASSNDDFSSSKFQNRPPFFCFFFFF